MNPLIKKIIIALAIIIVIAIGYRFFVSPSAPATTLSSNSPVTTSNTTGGTAITSEVGQQLVTTLLNLKTIRLNDQIFASPLFASLSDYTITLGTGVAGRANPFAPIGVDKPLATATVSSSATADNPTSAPASPLAKTVLATNLTKNSATLNGTIVSNTAPFSAWFEWSKVGATTANKTTIVNFAGSVDSFSAPITGLLPSTAYTFKAFIKIGNVTLSGASDAFTTPAN